MAEKKPDEFNVLFGTPYGQSEKTVGPQQPSVGMDYFDKAQAVKRYQEQEAAQKAAELATPQWGKTVGSGVQKAAASAVGMPGDIGDFLAAVPTLAGKAAAYMGVPVTPPKYEDVKKSMQAAAPYMPAPMQAFFRGPTTEQVAEYVNPYAEKVFGVGPQYEPKTKTEKVVKSGLEYGLPAILGRPVGALRRVIGGVGGAGVSEVAGQATEGTAIEPYARLVAAGLAPLAIEKSTTPLLKLGERFVAPTRAAKQELGEGLGDYAAESSALAYRMSKTKDVVEAANEAQGRIRKFTENILGTTQTAPQFVDMVDRLGKLERDNVYGLVRSNPAAQAIDQSLFSDLASQAVFKKASENAIKNGANVPEWGIVPPQVISGKPSQKIGPGGAQYDVPTPDIVRPGNLAFYDQVKRELDSIMEQTYRSGDTSTYQSAQNARAKLLNRLDAIVPQYRDARGIAADTFLTSSAPEAGAKFFTMSDIYGLDDFKNAFNSYNNEQKQAFRVGLMGRLEQELATKNPETITNKFLNNPQFMGKFDFAFGPEVAGQIRSKVLSENMIQQAEKIRRTLKAQESMKKAQKYEGLKSAGIVGAATLGLAEATNLQFMLQNLMSLGISPTSIGLGAGAMLATVAGQVALSATDRMAAKKMISLIKSNDPANYGKINALIDQHPDVYPYIMTTLQAIEQAPEAAKGKEKKPELPQEGVEESYQRLLREGKIKPVQADGGRVARAAGGKVEIEAGVKALMNAAENARKSISKTTENLLKQPDEQIAQALNIAKRHI